VKSLPDDIAERYDIVVVSPRNYFLYTPLLPAACTGTMEDRSIVEPVRTQIKGKARYFEAVCQSVDPEAKELVCCFPKDAGIDQACFKVGYDLLVTSVGSINNTFGTPGVEENCYFFKTIDDAKRLRKRVSELFERASLPHTPVEERRKLLSMVIVGGGPTGVEVAAELDDMIRQDLSKLYPDIIKDVKISVVELQDHILSMYDRKISDYAAKQFFRSEINLLLGVKVASVKREAVTLVPKDGKEEELPFGVCVWCTGIKLNPLAQQLQQSLPDGTQTNFRAITTDQYLRVKGSKGSIYSLGDMATIEQPRALEKLEELFAAADEDGDGTLTVAELGELLTRASDDYPHLEEYAEFLTTPDRFGGFARSIFAKSQKNKNTPGGALGGLPKDARLTREDFKELLTKIESNLRILPATAQVARQQGEYLASLLVQNRITGHEDQDQYEATFRPFQYNHKGSLAYVGDDNAVMDIPVIGPITGRAAGYGWKGFETISQISVRNQVLVATDWLRSKIFGRDISRF
jgi:NADH:ubiquinone reductase (non-electrogenic)